MVGRFRPSGRTLFAGCLSYGREGEVNGDPRPSAWTESHMRGVRVQGSVGHISLSPRTSGLFVAYGPSLGRERGVARGIRRGEERGGRQRWSRRMGRRFFHGRAWVAAGQLVGVEGQGAHPCGAISARIRNRGAVFDCGAGRWAAARKIAPESAQGAVCRLRIIASLGMEGGPSAS